MKLVQFDDGSYGVRRFGLFKDFKTSPYWWGRKSSYYHTDCRVTLERALLFLFSETGTGEKIYSRKQALQMYKVMLNGSNIE